MTFISAVIAVYNDPEGIKTTLDSLLSQDYPKRSFDIIIVDNNSSDNTRDVINNYVKNYPKRVSLLLEDKIQSSYAARNKAIKESKGEVLAFIDSDMTADKNWFNSISKNFGNTDIGYLGFGIDIQLTGKSVTGIYDKLTGFPVRKYMAERNFAGAGCIAVRKSTFEDVGLFDSQLISGGDFEFGDRCWRSGVKQAFVEEAKLHHPARESFLSLMKKNFRVGRGKRQLVKIYPNLRVSRLDLKDFLPPNPFKFFDKDFYLNKGMRIEDLRKSDILLLYGIDIATKLSRNLGYFYELSNEKTKK